MKRTLIAAVCLLALLTTNASAAANDPPEVPPGAGMGATAGYTRHEPGHWERTDVLYFCPLAETREADGVTVAAEWTETDNGKSARYTFTGEDGKQTAYTVEAFWFEERYYADD